MNTQISVSVSSGAVTVIVNTNTKKADVQEALSLALAVLKENAESINGINQQVVGKIPEFVSSKPIGEHEEISKLMALNAEKLKIPQMAVVAVQVYGNLTRPQIKNYIENWGKRVGDNFAGGNFNRDLLKKVLLRETGNTPDGETLYGLTEKGKVEAEKIVTELQGEDTE